MSFKDRAFISAMGLVPKKTLSRVVRRLAQTESQVAIRRFAERYGCNLDEAEKPLEEYASLVDFFTRRLKPGTRPLDPDPNAVLSPVDGVIDASGTIEDGALLQAKGRSYSLAALLADPELAATYEGGRYMTLYLSPKDYHRVHCPVDALVTAATYVPGRLYPVNPAAVAHVDELFATNERLVTHLESGPFGPIEYVMVGATIVGHIRVEYDDTLRTNIGGKEIFRSSYEPPIGIERGGELGVFEMGSTVILITTAKVELDAFEPGTPIKMGMRIGSLSA